MTGRDYRPGNRLFDERRAEARARIDRLDDQGLSDPTRHQFFHAVYERAGDDAAAVPWAKLAPHPLLTRFLETEPKPPRGMTALDVGCGLGDNAEALAGHGFDVTAFDLVPDAIDWAKKRFPASKVDWQVADIFQPPPQWKNAFDLVHECYTIQAVTPRLHGAMMQAIGDCVKPGGRLVVIAKARDVAEPVFEPPWPLAREEFTPLTAFGFRELDFVETISQTGARTMRDMLVVFEKVG